MTIKILFNHDHKTTDRSRLFNWLSKTTTALSIPLMVASTGAAIKHVAHAPSANLTSISIFGHTPLINAGLLGSIMLSSAGLFFRRQSAIAKNIQPQFVTSPDKIAELNAAITRAKTRLMEDDGAYFDNDVKNGKPVRFPTMNFAGSIYPFLMMSSSEIEKLPPLNKCIAYIAQIRCMTYFAEKATGEPTSYGYAPDIPVAQRTTLMDPLYRFNDIVDTLKKDHAIAQKKFSTSCPNGLSVEISEKVKEHKVIEKFHQDMSVNGACTGFLSVIAPVIPAIYSSFNAALVHFEQDIPLIDEPHIYNVLNDLESQARRACGLPPQRKIMFDTRYSDVKTLLTTAPTLALTTPLAQPQ